MLSTVLSITTTTHCVHTCPSHTSNVTIFSGYSVGSLAGGLMYKALGGSMSFRVFSGFALACSLVHWLLYLLFFRNTSTTPAVGGQKQGNDSLLTVSE